MTERPIFEAIEEWRAYLDDLNRAVYSTFDGVLARYAAQIAPGSTLGSIIDGELPVIDFDRWYAAVRSTMGGMVGSASLTWPLPRPERVATQRELILRMSRGEITTFELGHYFFHSGHANDHIRNFVDQVVEPFHRDLVTILNRHVQSEKRHASKSAPVQQRSAPRTAFVGADRLLALEQLQGRCGFDLRKLLALCREMNDAWTREAWFSLAFLTRCLLDHVPPAFGRRTFAEVASQETGRSFKAACAALDAMARKVADAHLHAPMRDNDALPNAQQTNASQGLDVLLAETIVRLEARAQERVDDMQVHPHASETS